MQRFKKEIITRRGTHYANGGNCNERASNPFGKFVYGANGTLTQAARWRLNAFLHLSMMNVGIQKRVASPGYRTIPGFAFANLAHHASAAKSKLQCAREGGCYLP